MKKIWKRTLAMLLVVIMVGGAAPMSVRASAKTIGEYAKGDLVEFGWYPQSRVTDPDLIASLTATLTGDDLISYGYYSGTGSNDDGQMLPSDYMLYCDVLLGGVKYRWVWFSRYRPAYTGHTSFAGNSCQADNGYENGTPYWFRFEPLQWRVLDPAAGLVMCETIIDSQPYNNYFLSSGLDKYGYTAYWGDAEKTHYANNYAESSLRQWLNNDFYNTAFSPTQQAIISSTTLDNSAYSTSYSAYDSASTTDKVFLLSYSDALNPAYGFSSSYSTYDAVRGTNGSDYAKCQGLFETTYQPNKCSAWRLRSAGSGSYGACSVSCVGSVLSYLYYVNDASEGILPALKFNLTSVIFQSDVRDVGTGTGSGAETLSSVVQTHVIDDPQTKNRLYAALYLDNLGVPLDGTHGNPDLCLPGLVQNRVPQGLTYWRDRNWFLISAYDAAAKEPNEIFALDASTGRCVGQYTVQGVSASNHIGGIAVTAHNLYLTLSNSRIGYVPLSDFIPSGKAETVEVKAIASLSGVLNGANTSYLNFSEGCIWVGNYYRHDVSAYKTPASDTANSRVLGYAVSGDSSEEEWNALRGFADPDHRINIPNSIEGIQGAALGDGKIYLHSSFNRTKKSVLTVMDFTPGVQDSLRNMRQFDSMPMGEGICMKDGELYLLYESAAAKYRNGDGKGSSAHPTDVLWKFRYGTTPFDPEKDSFSFGNWEDDYNGFSGKSLSMPDEYRDILFYHRLNVINLVTAGVQFIGKWGGSCFGMSAVAALLKSGAISPGYFQSGAVTAKDLEAPAKSSTVEGLVNYYHIMQSVYPNTLDLLYSGSEEKALETLVSQIHTSEYPVLITFAIYKRFLHSRDGGHAVLGYGIEDKGDWWRIDICDPNKSCRYLFVKKDYSDSYFTSSNEVRGQYSYENDEYEKKITHSYTAESASETYDYMNLQKALEITRSGGDLSDLGKFGFDYVEDGMLILNYQNFRIADSDGNYAVVSNGEVTEGNLDVAFTGVYNEIGSELKVGYRFPLPAEGVSYTITPSPDETSVVTGEPLESFCTSFILDTQDGLSAAVETGACAQIAIEGGDTVHVSGSSACTQSITLAKADVQTDWIACTVSGSAQDLTVWQTDAGVSLQSNQSCELDAAVLDVFNKTELGTVTVSSGQADRIEQGEQPGEIIVKENGEQRTVSIGCSVVFHTSGGTEIPALTDLPAGSVIAQPDDPTLLGYVFDGWYTSTEYLLENRWDFATDTVNENISLYAKWISLKDETCTEEFYLHKTDTEPAAVMKLAYQSPIAVPEGFDRVGYTLELVDCDTDRPVNLETDVMGQNGIRVYAKYTPVTYYASFLVDGVQLGEKVLFTVETEKLAVPSDPIKAGYTFIGWSPEVPATMPAEDLEFTAVFEQDKYIATLIADGVVVKTIEYTHGQKSIQLPEVPEKEGFTGAWPSYSLTDGGVTITAVYTKNQYTITWIVDGEMLSNRVYFGDTIQKPADPIKDNFTFVGWSPDVPLTMPAKDMTFEAVFEKNPKSNGYLVGVSLQNLTLFYKDSGKLIPKVLMQGEAKYTVTYKVENERILSVSEDGTVKTLHWGKTNVTATVSDENGNSFSVTCAVQVKCYLWQWLIIIFLFGWIWY